LNWWLCWKLGLAFSWHVYTSIVWYFLLFWCLVHFIGISKRSLCLILDENFHCPFLVLACGERPLDLFSPYLDSIFLYPCLVYMYRLRSGLKCHLQTQLPTSPFRGLVWEPIRQKVTWQVKAHLWMWLIIRPFGKKYEPTCLKSHIKIWRLTTEDDLRLAFCGLKREPTCPKSGIKTWILANVIYV